MIGADATTRTFRTGLTCAIAWLISVNGLSLGDSPMAKDLEFFEKKIRPILTQNCYRCHSATSRKVRAGLRLDHRAGLLRGGESGPALSPGSPEKSLLIQVLKYVGDGSKMPPKGKLPDKAIRDFEHWVKTGAHWPDSTTAKRSDPKTDPRVITQKARAFWSFQPVQSPVVPEVRNGQWAKNAIDQFILQKLEQEKTSPAEPAQKRKLLRRVTFDLTGLPPTPDEMNAYLGDESPHAFEKVVERLLASPRYGERWARHWLDGMRYVSDVGYYNFSDLGWRYRDWVIDALNHDLPYDQFIVHQIAGDLLPAPEGEKIYREGIIATGALAMGNYDDQESNKENLYAEVMDDQIDLVSRQFLGLTISCARCHDHKFDPILQTDYYALGGIFLSSRVLKTGNRIGAPRLKIPLSPGDAIGIQEGGYSDSRHKQIGDMKLYVRGNPHQPGPVVPRRFPIVLAGENQIPIGQRTKQSGRLELAQWIANEKNPLTPRVMANRIWQHHFGQGLVRTPSNFGARGERPTHPELLDYLADYLVKSGWSVKALHRLILTSATYQQSTTSNEEVQIKDPENRWLSRFTPRRMSAEEIHDALLAVSGELRNGLGQGQGNRAIYLRRGHEHPWRMGTLFDAPAVGTIAPVRTTSTVAPQSLFLMNDVLLVKAAQQFTRRLEQRTSNDHEQIRLAYQWAFGREATPKEISIGERFLARRSRSQRWTYFQVLLCTNEWVYLD